MSDFAWISRLTLHRQGRCQWVSWFLKFEEIVGNFYVSLDLDKFLVKLTYNNHDFAALLDCDMDVCDVPTSIYAFCYKDSDTDHDGLN